MYLDFEHCCGVFDLCQQEHAHVFFPFILLVLFLFLLSYHTIVSELDPFPLKKSQKLAADDGLLSSCGVCFTQMLLSVEPLRLEQLPLLPPPRLKLRAEPKAPRRSWGSAS